MHNDRFRPVRGRKPRYRMSCMEYTGIYVKRLAVRERVGNVRTG